MAIYLFMEGEEIFSLHFLFASRHSLCALLAMNPLLILGALLVVTGLVGIILPFLPGPPLIFAGLLLGAWSDSFSRVGFPILALLFIMTLIAIGAETFLGAVAARG